MNAHHLSVSWRPAIAPTLAFFVALACPSLAHAEGDNEAAETAAARTLAVDGVRLAQSEKCAEAVDKLEPAEKLKHSPIVLRHLGECQVKLGRWVEGSESLRKLLREPLPENASPALTNAYEAAAATLRDVKPRIPSMKITLDAPPDTDFTIKVDGKELADSAVGVSLPTDPGEHTVEASAPGFLKAKSSVNLQASSAAMVTLELKRDPNAPLPSKAPPATRAALVTTAPVSAAPSRPPPPVSTGVKTGKVLGYVSYAVAAGGLAVGAAFGASAMSDEKKLRGSCPNKVCTPEQQDALESAQTKGTIATIGFAVAGGGAALGTILLLTSSSSSPAAAQSGVKPRTATFSRPRAQIGAGNVTFVADF
jgi:hypothetical protein